MKYRPRPMTVEARQVSPDNLEDVAMWCAGAVKSIRPSSREQVIVFWSQGEEQRAEVCDYIFKDVVDVFRVATSDDFEVFFEHADQ